MNYEWQKLLLGVLTVCCFSHKNADHSEVCRSTKYLMLHVRDCPGTTATFDVCPFPWCRKVKHLLFHLVSCSHPQSCAMCSSKHLSRNMKRLQCLNKHRGETYKAELLARLRSKTKKSSNKPKMGNADVRTHAQEVVATTEPLAVPSNDDMAPSTLAVSTKPINVSSSVQATKEEYGAAASTAAEGETSKSCIKAERLEVDEKVKASASDTGSRCTAIDAMASDPPARIQTGMTDDMDSSAVISPSPDDSLDYQSIDPSLVASSETGASAEETRTAANGNGVMVVPSSSSSSSSGNNDKPNSTMSKLDVESLISARVAAEAAAIMDNASDSDCHLSPPPLSAPPSPLTAA
jgi:TAZ zinc finger